MLHIKINYGDIIAINPLTITIEEGNDDCNRYHKSTDKKWINFCKKHNFHTTRDASGKIYDLYLQLCAEGII